MIDLSRTKAAILRYDSLPRTAYAERDQAAREVGEAFGADTIEVNDPETCAACVRPGKALPPGHPDESFARRMVRRWEAERRLLIHKPITD